MPAGVKQRGFTLLELSIVIVLISLLVGGIMLGQDIIKGSRLRGTIAQIEEYNSAAHVFLEKYKYYPGDMLSSEASRYGFFTETTLGGTNGHQDGDGLIEGGSAGTQDNFIGEIPGFWRHLTDAQMIDGNYCTTTSGNPLIATTGLLTTTAAAGLIRQVLPPTKFDNGSYIFPFRTSSENYFQIALLTGISAVDGSGTYPASNGGLTPLDARNMDIKLDDGMADSGRVRAGLLSGTYLAGMGTCIGATDSVYDTGSATADQPQCALKIKFK